MIIYAISSNIDWVTNKDFEKYVDDELIQVKKLIEKSIIRNIQKRIDIPWVILTLETSSLEEAKKYCDELPVIKHNLVKLDYFPVWPFIF